MNSISNFDKNLHYSKDIVVEGDETILKKDMAK
jgi:hypothetical protein